MTHYEHSLRAMEYLLTTVGEEHWAKCVRVDIEKWTTAGDTSHHSSAYGGMGSFNDIMICRANQHKVTEAQEPWASELFEWLKAVCYYLAKHPKKRITAESLKKAVDRHDSVLAGFARGAFAGFVGRILSTFGCRDKVAKAMRGLAGEEQKLHGCRCLRCGYSEISNRNIATFIADDLLPDLVFRACETFALIELVDQILALDIPGLDQTHRQIAAAVKAADIVVNDRDGWMWSCRKCGKDDTAAYRWQLQPEQPPRFVPSDDTLPIRE